MRGLKDYEDLRLRRATNQIAPADNATPIKMIAILAATKGGSPEKRLKGGGGGMSANTASDINTKFTVISSRKLPKISY
jgi:hypothetical protein